MDINDLSTLEYLYDLRCTRASSETHSAAAVPKFRKKVSHVGFQYDIFLWSLILLLDTMVAVDAVSTNLQKEVFPAKGQNRFRDLAKSLERSAVRDD